MGRTTRTRKADILTDLPDAPEQPIDVGNAKINPPAPAAPAPARKLDNDDLAAIASMSMDDLAALMDGEDVGKGVAVGDKVTGTISRIGRDAAFVEIGAKSEGQLALEEALGLSIGDTVTAYVVAATDWGIRISMRLSGAAADQALEDAVASGVPVEGVVTKRNSGGFEVRIGSARAFCPISQMERHIDPAPDAYIGNTYSFRVLEADDKVVVSRRAILEEDLEERITAFWASVTVGDEFEGIISNIRPFGVFVDLGGVDGLVPQRELSWDPTASVTRGQRLEVRVLDIDHEARKLTLSAKDPGSSPWSTRVGTEFIEGGTYSGLVVRIESFGAFIELAPGLHGLLHPSRAGGPLPAEGDRVDVKLVEIDEDRQRLALASTDYVTTGDMPAVPDEVVTGTVREVLGNGVLIDLEDGRAGWLGAREVELPAGTVLAQRFRRGRKVTARVKEVESGRNRLNLTQKAGASEGAKAWKQHNKAAKQESFGTFGDLLKGWKN